MDVILVQPQLLGELFVGKVEPHQIQTKNPFAQWLMMLRKDGIGQIIKITVTGSAMVALPFFLPLIVSTLFDLVGVTPSALDASGPAQLTHSREAFGIIDQVIELEQVLSMRRGARFLKELWEKFFAPCFGYWAILFSMI